MPEVAPPSDYFRNPRLYIQGASRKQPMADHSITVQLYRIAIKDGVKNMIYYLLLRTNCNAMEWQSTKLSKSYTIAGTRYRRSALAQI